MTASSPHATTLWRLDGNLARLDGSALQAVVDVTAPSRGLTQLEYRGVARAGWLLGVDVSTEPSDAYVRGGDLVVAYRETAERPFSVQVYWSVGPSQSDDGVILDATISIQTRQWEAYPRVTVFSSIDDAELTSIDAGALLVRPSDADWSYAEVTPPEDFVHAQRSERELQPQSPLTRWLFGEQFLERGVIRRLRLRGALVPRHDDLAAASCLRASLLAEQPPLTA